MSRATAVRLGVLATLAVVLFWRLRSLENLLVFDPARYPVVNPLEAGVPVEDVFFSTEDGQQLNGWWLKARAGKGTIIFCHGQATNLSSLSFQYQMLAKQGVGLFAFDYRGFGRSTGQPDEEGLIRDALAAHDECLKRGVGFEDIVVHGQSLGGAVAAQLCARRPCAGLILESTFTSVADVAGTRYGTWSGLLLQTKFATAATLPALRVPVLVIHGTRDHILPAQMGTRLFEAARVPKQLWMVQDGGHLNLRLVAGEEYAKRITGFVADCVLRRK